MPAVEEAFPDHGDPDTWVQLSGEQKRCLIGLQNYHIKIEDKSADIAAELAWRDLKAERDRKTRQLAFPELANATWYKS